MPPSILLRGLRIGRGLYLARQELRRDFVCALLVPLDLGLACFGVLFRVFFPDVGSISPVRLPTA